MKKYFLLTALLFCFAATHAQKQKADSLAALLAKEKTDTGRVTYMWKISSYLYSYAPDSALRIAQKALFLSRRIKYVEGESRSLGQMANGFLSMSDYPHALEYYLQKLKLEEQRNNPYNLAGVTMNIGIVYVYREEYEKALLYLYRADSIITANNITDLKFNINLNIGDVYNRKNIPDSAFNYFSRSLLFAGMMQDGDFTGIAMTGLAHVYLQLHRYDKALEYYRDGIANLESADDEDMLCEASLGLAKLYDGQNDADSAAYFGRRSFSLAKKDSFSSRQLEAAVFLTELYKKVPNNDSAYFYLQQEQALGALINSKEKIRESQNISISEQLRQDEMADNLKKAKEERSQQLQLLLIGLFIPTFFLITILLSRIRLHIRVIRFLGIISLLILFEYLTLLLHPMVLNITHHTPFLELLIFVAIASMLIPAHHRIEHRLIEKLTGRKRSYSANNLIIKRQKLKIKKTP